MRRFLAFIAASTCAAVAGLQAQTPSPAARRYVVIGCVSREAPASSTSGASAAPRFILTDLRGPSPSIYVLDGDANTLSFHVGHTLEIAGTLATGSGATAGPPPKAQLLKVVQLTYLSTRCQPIR